MPGSRGPAHVPMNPRPVQRRAQPLVVHVALQQLGHGQVEQHLQGLRIVADEGRQGVAVGGVAHPRVAVGPAQPVAQAPVHVLVGEVPGHVGGGEARHLGGRPAVVAPLGERRAVVERAPRDRVGQPGPVAVSGQVELGDDQRVQQPDQVGARADPVAAVG
ncbi:MAG: hypothetical protein LC792_11445, partial [Actinobacteria bacterium]|nr:hypothetical protein [Actinomycetota bacterium]